MPPIVLIDDACEPVSHRIVPQAFRILFAVLLPLLLVLPVHAQQFVVKGELPKAKSSNLSLTIYDGDTSARVLTSRVRSSFRFEGTVSRPVLASLSGDRMNGTLYFYLENSEITLSLNLDNPSLSRVNGSRTNSQYRYAMEECVGESAVSCAKEYVVSNPASIFSPYIIYDRLGTLPFDEISDLYSKLEGDALHTYHYALLSKKIARNQSVVEGQPMPDFAFYGDEGLVHFDSVRSRSGCNLILVGASWCAACRHAEEILLDLVLKARPHTIRIDRQPQQWDAPCLQDLVIDHIPYMILVDAQGNIAGRDLRVWEISRRLDAAGCSSKSRPRQHPAAPTQYIVK